MREKAFYFICIFAVINLVVASWLALSFPEPTNHIAKIIDTCVNAFYLSLVGLIGMATGSNNIPPDEPSKS